ncbi:MAG: nucleotidyl transferase AbiEii/AbiGii toxin family protein [Terrimicrobiaceae bacterium]
MPETPDIFQTCVDAAAGAGSDFLLIGGHAVNARGYERTTLDIDFLIAGRDLRIWSAMLDQAGYRLITESIKAFAQFEPREGEGFRVDLMLVDDGTFAKLLAGSEWRDYGRRRVRVIGVLHLIALKLHALHSEHRVALGKDYLDILNLIRLNRIDIHSSEFDEVINRYGTESVRDRIRRDIEEPL